MLNTKKLSVLFFAGIVGILSAYDVRTKELVPVKFEKAPAHAAVKMVEDGKLNFAIVADLNAEQKMQRKNKTEKSIAPAIEILKEAFLKSVKNYEDRCREFSKSFYK